MKPEFNSRRLHFRFYQKWERLFNDKTPKRSQALEYNFDGPTLTAFTLDALALETQKPDSCPALIRNSLKNTV